MVSKIAITFEVTPDQAEAFTAHCTSYLATMKEKNVVEKTGAATMNTRERRREKREHAGSFMAYRKKRQNFVKKWKLWRSKSWSERVERLVMGFFRSMRSIMGFE